MGVLKNRHFVLAMLVAPVLTVIAYFATDYLVSEPPQRAERGQSYELAAKSNCRYQSGACTLKNGDVEVHIRAERVTQDQVLLILNSDLAIGKALIAVAWGDTASGPEAMAGPTKETGDWRLQTAVDQPDKCTIRLALNIAGSTYYAEVPAIFVDYVTTFSRENFSG